MTSSHQGHKIAEAFGYRLSLKEVHPSSGLFVFIRVHLWFVFMNDQPFFLLNTSRRGSDWVLPGSAGVPPASCPFGRRCASVRCCRQPPCGREPHRPGRRRAMAPFPVDSSGGDVPGCARLGAGGTPALPGSHHPMTSSHQGHQIAEAFWRRLGLKEIHLSSGLFVLIRVHWWFVFMNGQPFFLLNTSRRGSDWVLPGSAGVPPACCPFGRR